MNKAIYKSLILLVGAMLMACQGGKGNAPSKEAEPKETVKQTGKVRNISLYLYDDFPVQKAQMLADALKEAYPSVSIQKESLVLPKEHYNRERKRYSGTGLLKDLSKLRKGNVVLGLTDEIIFKANEHFLFYSSRCICGSHIIYSSIRKTAHQRPFGEVDDARTGAFLWIEPLQQSALFYG